MSRGRLLNVAALVFGIGVMAALCMKIGWHEIGRQMARVGWGFVWVCVAGSASNVVEAAALWIAIDRRCSFSRVYGASIAGAAVNQFTPLSEAGEAIKWNLLKDAGGSESVASGVLAWNVCFRITKYAYAFLAPLMVLLVHPSLFPARTLALLEVAAIVAFIPSLIFFILVWSGSAEFVVRMFQRLPFLRTHDPAPLLERARRIDVLVRRFAGSRLGDALAINALLFVARLLSGLEVWTAQRALGADTDVPTALFLYGGMLIVSVYLSIAPVQIGVAEAGQYFLFGLVGMSPALGFAQGLVRRVRALISNALGFAYLAYRSARVEPRPGPPDGLPPAGPP
ncbi:MAG: lysylphosphatidylglycerol synthase transmembrane domain-containing protein [Myxococcota bacterium]